MGSRTRRGWVVITTLMAAVTLAHAERPTIPAVAMTAAPRAHTITEDIAERLTRLSVRAEAPSAARLTLDGVEFRLDRRTRHALLLLHGESSLVSFRLASDISVRRGAAAFDTRLEIAIAGHRLAVDLPALELAPRSYLGERYLEVRVPIVRRTF